MYSWLIASILKIAQSKSRKADSEVQGKTESRSLGRLMNAAHLKCVWKLRRKVFVLKGWKSIRRKWKSEIGALRRDM